MSQGYTQNVDLITNRVRNATDIRKKNMVGDSYVILLTGNYIYISLDQTFELHGPYITVKSYNKPIGSKRMPAYKCFSLVNCGEGSSIFVSAGSAMNEYISA